MSARRWLAALLLALMCLAGRPASADCGRNEGAGLSTLPVLTPSANGTLSLTIRAERARVPVMIGDVPVTDVPVFVVQPQAGTRLRSVDAFGKPAEDLPARCLTTPQALYSGSVWALRQGDRLRIALTSALDFHAGDLPVPPAGGMSCRGINLHTHGLLVSPARQTEPDGTPSIGDQAFDMAVPPGDAASPGDPCAGGGGNMDMTGTPLHHSVAGTLTYMTRIPGQPGQSGRDDGEHPSGIFWFHPHTHGYSGPLTSGGMAGLITIGALGDYLCVEDAGGCIAPDAVPVRTMMLKDAEILPDHGGWTLAHERVYALEDACTQSAGKDEDRHGECRDYRGRRWLFTINGARYPVISDIMPGRGEVWRIVNASPNMSYRLRLRPVGQPQGAALALQVLSLEGAAPAPVRPIAPQTVRELLLMPASRAEIMVASPPAGGAYVLEQQPFTTGGDSWPRILLAELRMPPAQGAPAALRLRAAPPPKAPPEHTFDHTDRPACDYPLGSTRHILLVARPAFSDDRRRATTFGMIAGIERPDGPSRMFDADGQPQPMTQQTWNALLAHDAGAPAFMHNPYGTVCTYVGHTETWIIDNYTAEAHNFHIHQTEFRMAEAHRDDPAYFSPAPDNGLGALQRASDTAIATATATDDATDRAGEPTSLYRDTVPVPRGVSAGGRGCDGSPFNDRCKPGRITLIVRFDRDAQIGTFVYHCHILQHEDAGMMAIMQVLCPPGDAACAARHPDHMAPMEPSPR